MGKASRRKRDGKLTLPCGAKILCGEATKHEEDCSRCRSLATPDHFAVSAFGWDGYNPPFMKKIMKQEARKRRRAAGAGGGS
jgi:hypothetical protein